MDQGDICICGHTREVHFGRECSIIAKNSPIRRDCPCKQFVVLDLAVEIFEVLKQLVEISGEATIPLVNSHAVRKMSKFLSATERAKAVIAESEKS